MADEFLRILDELTKEEFDRFIFYLHDRVDPIPEGQMENKTKLQVGILMRKKYGEVWRVKITWEILKKIYRNDLAQKLERNPEMGLISGDGQQTGRGDIQPWLPIFSNCVEEMKKNKVNLTEILMMDPEYIFQHVQQESLITWEEYSDIRSIERTRAKLIDLLDKMIGKGEDTCRDFFSLLQKPKVLMTFPELKKFFSQAATDNLIKNTPSASPTTSRRPYSMSSLPRGHCLIFNNQRFDIKSLGERKGSDQDAVALERVFSWLGFIVDVLQDQSKQEMCSKLQEYRSMKHGDCFVCCVLSHGSEEGIYGRDGQPLQINDLLSPFNAANCRSLADKPKVFFIQACQGTRAQIVVNADCAGGATDPGTDASAIHRYTIPTDSDFLVGMSTVQECVSIRVERSGTWYIQALCQELEMGCLRGDTILEILTTVNEEVSKKRGNLKGQVVGQMPEPRYTLRRNLIFPVPSGSSPPTGPGYGFFLLVIYVLLEWMKKQRRSAEGQIQANPEESITLHKILIPLQQMVDRC